MTIRIGCTLGITDTLELPRILAAMKAAGFDGVELAGIGDDGSVSLLLRNAEETLKAVREAGLTVTSIATRIALHHREESAWQRAKLLIVRAAELAAYFEAPVVRLFGLNVGRGESRSEAIGRAGTHWGEACAALPAGAQGISLAVQNGGSFINARELWQMLETAGKGQAGIAWDVAEATLTRESPTLSVHTLNSRIRQVRIWDHEGTRTPVALGSGQVDGEVFLQKLRGIGFAGWMVYAPPSVNAAMLSAEEHAAQYTAAAETLKVWAGLKAPPAAVATPEAPAVKPAPAVATAKA